MKCSKCGNEISNNYAVCPHCGTSRAANQGASQSVDYDDVPVLNVNVPRSNFCVMCGKSIPDGYTMCPECSARSVAMTDRTMPAKSNAPLIIVVVMAVLIMLGTTALVLAWSSGIIGDNAKNDRTEEKSDQKVNDSEENIEDSENQDDSGDKEKDEEKEKDEDDSNILEAGSEGKNNEESGKIEGETKKEHRYVGYNPGYPITWESARAEAERKGGYLACPNTWEEFEKIRVAAVNAKLDKIWLGVRRTGDSWYSSVYCLDGTSNIGYTNWLKGEPSNYDRDKWDNEGVMIEERYLMAFKSKSGTWLINDTANDISYAYKNIGYVIEMEN